MATKERITILGMGAMGSRMAKNLLNAKYNVTVWNRTPEACKPLIKAGASTASTPKEAVKEADIVISMVRDNEASAQVWLTENTGAIHGMDSTTIAIESSTLTSEWVKELGSKFLEKNIPFLEAPVSGSRPQADAGVLVYLVAGEENTLEHVKPVLQILGSKIQFTGPIGSAAMVKLCTNTLLGIQVAALAEIISLLQHEGIDEVKAIKAISETTVWSPVAHYISDTMLQENFTPQFTLDLIKKDFDYMLKSNNSNIKTPTISAVHSLFSEGLNKGLGEDNMTGIIQLFKDK